MLYKHSRSQRAALYTGMTTDKAGSWFEVNRSMFPWSKFNGYAANIKKKK